MINDFCFYYCYIEKKKKIDDGKIPKNFQIDNWQQNAVVN